MKPFLCAALVAAGAMTMTGSARADVIGSLTSAASGNFNDAITWSNFGGDASFLPSPFSAYTDSGFTAGVTGGSQLCGGSTTACSFYLGTSTSLSSNGSGSLTLTLPSVGALGFTIGAPGAKYPGAFGENHSAAPFTATLTLYGVDGSTLGSVSATSDQAGDSMFLGAYDATGENIAAAKVAITQVGSPPVYRHIVTPTTSIAQTNPTTVTILYDGQAGHTDPAFCSSFSSLNTLGKLRCPQQTYQNDPNFFPFTVAQSDWAADGITLINGSSPSYYFLFPSVFEQGGGGGFAGSSSCASAGTYTDGSASYTAPPGCRVTTTLQSGTPNVTAADLANFVISPVSLRISRPAPGFAAGTAGPVCVPAL